MRITCTRTGGVAGIKMTCSVDSETLSAREATRLHKLVEAADLRNLASRRSRGGAMPDAFHYTIELDEDGQHRLLDFGEDAPEGVAKLVQWLTARARATRGRK